MTGTGGHQTLIPRNKNNTPLRPLSPSSDGNAGDQSVASNMTSRTASFASANHSMAPTENTPLVGRSLSLIPSDVHRENQELTETTTSSSVWQKILEFRTSRQAVAAVVALAIFTDMVVYGVVLPTLPRMVTEKLHMDPKYLGLLMSCYAVGLIGVTPIVGVISDKYKNRKVPMLVGLCGLFVTTILYAHSTDFIQLIISRTLQGVAGGISWTVGFGMLAEVYPKESLGAITGSVMTANTVGFLVGPPIGGALFEYVSESAPFYFCAALALLDLAGRLFIRPKILSSKYQAIDATSPLQASESGPTSYNAIEDQAGDSNTIVEFEESGAISILSLLGDPQILVTLLCVVVNAAVISGIEPTLPIYLEKTFGSSPSEIGGLWMLIVIPSMIAGIIAGHLSDHYGRKSITAIAMLFFGLGTPLMAFAPNLIYLSLTLIVFGIFSAVAMTPALPEMADFIHARGSDSFATAYAMFNVAYSGGMIIGPILGSFLFDRYGFLTQMVVFGAMLFIVSPIAGIFWVLGRRGYRNIEMRHE